MIRATLSVLALSLPGVASAQCNGDPIVGTPQYNLMYGAINTNAQVFGAAALLEDHLLPVAEIAPTGVVHYTVTAAPGALAVPVDCGNSAALQAVDLSAGAIGGAINTGPVTWFLSASSAAHMLAPQEWNERAVSPFVGAGFILAAPVAFYQRQFFIGDDWSFTFDAMAGARADLEVVQLSAAYVASQGVYTNVASDEIRLFVGTVSRPFGGEPVSLAKLLPYFRGGFSDLDWLVGDSVDKIGHTAIFARSLQHEGVSAVDRGDGGAAVSAVENEVTPFSTLHLLHRGIGRHVDFAAAVAVAPAVTVHELTIGLSAGQSMTEAQMVSWIEREGFADTDFGGVRLEGGMIRMPDQYWLGQPGAVRARWNVDVNLGGYEGDSFRLFFMSIGMNNSETLAVFPYSKNVGYMKISGSFM